MIDLSRFTLLYTRWRAELKRMDNLRQRINALGAEHYEASERERAAKEELDLELGSLMIEPGGKGPRRTE